MRIVITVELDEVQHSGIQLEDLRRELVSSTQGALYQDGMSRKNYGRGQFDHEVSAEIIK